MKVITETLPDEGYYRNVPDECYYRNVPDECYSRNVPDEGYSRNASCALHLISTFLVCSEPNVNFRGLYFDRNKLV